MAIKALESPVVQVSLLQAAPLVVTGALVVEEPGPALSLKSGEVSTTPGTTQTLISEVVPPGKTWRIRGVEVVSRAYGAFTATIATASFKVGKTGPAEPTVMMPCRPYEIAEAGQVVALDFLQAQGPVVPVEARIYYTEA